MSHRPVRRGALIFLLLVFFPLQGTAQDRDREPVTHTQVISGGPLLLTVGGFNAEYEKKLSELMTFGVAGGWMESDDDDYTGLAGFLRFYPQRAALTGFYFGGRGGLYNADDGEEAHTVTGLGIEIGYAWLLGPGRSFFLSLGFGGIRLLGDVGEANQTIPSLRLLDVGIAF